MATPRPSARHAWRRSITSVNPATDRVVARYREASPSQVARALETAAAAFEDWRRTDIGQRAHLMRRVGTLLRERANAYAELMATEMGKPLAQGKAEVEKCAWACDYYAENAGRFLAPEVVATDATKSFVAFEPLGVVLAIMPWNFPFWQVFRFAAPALMAGNGGVLKHASNVSGCALAIEEVFRDAGFPLGLFRTLIVGSARVRAIIEHAAVKAVTLTGSTAAGKAVAARAGAVVKKTVLELGGSDPYVVLEDADLDLAVETCVASRLINGGQSCIAAKRFIVVRPIAAEFTERFVEAMRGKRMDHPLAPGVDLGPLARRDLRDQLHRQVTRSVSKGARLLLGGRPPRGEGAYYPPTVLARVSQGMPAYDEELFGPVAALIEARDERDAIRIANDSPFGLGAAVFTRDIARGERIATEQLAAGSCFVNAFVRSDPRLPFGGIKESGYGRELSSFGIREFVNVKTVWVR
ncbi:MAG TPA: NAD-dependent succinate-semialdehyde dehydrogenase [Gemmatimonadales bacterium]|nr:NAD-dependent succinate-semialdehyde dehydrogenase [Gemmatimonadales bacterium]